MQPSFGLDKIWKDSIPGANKPPRGNTPWQVILSMEGINLATMLSNRERYVQNSLKKENLLC